MVGVEGGVGGGGVKVGGEGSMVWRSESVLWWQQG